MMKKTTMLICLTITILVLAVAFFAFHGTMDIKTVVIDGYGSISVPKEWSTTVVNGFLHITRDENGEKVDVLVQYSSKGTLNSEFSDIADLVYIGNGTAYSNSAEYGKEKICYSDGSSNEMFVLTFDFFDNTENYDFTKFICVDKSISEDQIQKITKSFNWD